LIGFNAAARTKGLKDRIDKLKKEGKVDEAAALERMLNAPMPSMGVRPPLTPEELKKRRETRKFARLRMMHRRYGDALKRPELGAEVATHARRTARLSRLRTLIQEQPESPEREKRLQRVNQLMGMENARHQRKLALLAPDAQQNTVNAVSPQPVKPAEEPNAEEKKEEGK
jgi:hypothetical protein